MTEKFESPDAGRAAETPVDVTGEPVDVAPRASGRLVIAIDGPSGSGKSSVAKELARRLGAGYLDTGAMYRALAWHCVHEGVDLDDADAVHAAAASMVLSLSTDPDLERVVVGEHEVTDAIRTPAVTGVVSAVAAVIPVRELLRERQRREIDEAGRIVAEGRDITTVVAPDADARVLLTASEEVRMARRSGQLTAAGATGVDAATLTAQVGGRDRADAAVSRFEAPAEGVALVDSSELDFEQTVQAVMAAVNEQAVDSAVEGPGR
ncbi:(d)CMP kinase [Micrococcus cohnii]|mgnify:FL=1|uniref:Cytidylate kinase n=1 Tax=Micrococcus cohnii TaxID=993416 RepID=A0A7W7GNT6_9MICC|nr:(d)CMP kinase [Micrococcus cohnii]MBB4735461.1 cytidylate kinase [Micrococcus cohnii]